jgi:1-acyl-sn-glycerol-3-phosphate acyltransferase
VPYGFPRMRCPTSVRHSRGVSVALSTRLPERDVDYIRASVGRTWALLAAWFRPDIRGLEQIPAEGPVLLVGNHSGGNVAPDTLAFTMAFYRHFGPERPF